MSALSSSPALVFIPHTCSLMAEQCYSSCLCIRGRLWCRVSAGPALSASTTDEMSLLPTESLSPGRGKGQPSAARISPPLLAQACALRQVPVLLPGPGTHVASFPASLQLEFRGWCLIRNKLMLQSFPQQRGGGFVTYSYQSFHKTCTSFAPLSTLPFSVQTNLIRS